MIKWLNNQLCEIFHSNSESDISRNLEHGIIVLFVWISPLIFAIIATFKHVWGDSFQAHIHQFIAELLFYFGKTSLLSFSFGLIAGMKIWNKFKNKFFSWVVGILVVAMFWITSEIIANSISGVNWRYEQIIEEWLGADSDYF